MPCKLRKFLVTFAPRYNRQRLTESAAIMIMFTHYYTIEDIRDTVTNLVEFL